MPNINQKNVPPKKLNTQQICMNLKESNQKLDYHSNVQNAFVDLDKKFLNITDLTITCFYLLSFTEFYIFKTTTKEEKINIFFYLYFTISFFLFNVFFILFFRLLLILSKKNRNFN